MLQQLWSLSEFNTVFKFQCDLPLRHEFSEILKVMVYENSRDDSSSSSDGDDLDLLLVDTMFPSTVKLDFPRLNLIDLSDAQCEAMFRKVLSFCK